MTPCWSSSKSFEAFVKLNRPDWRKVLEGSLSTEELLETENAVNFYEIKPTIKCNY